MAVSLSRRARADLDDIREYTLRTWDRAQWFKYYRGIVSAFEMIEARPENGGDRSLFAPNLKSILCQKHVIFYTQPKSAKGEVVIVRIAHQSRYLPALTYYDDIE